MVCSSSFLSLLIVMLVYPSTTVQDLCGNTEKVIDICSTRNVTSGPDEGSIILTVKTMNECHCLFFIDNQVNLSLVNFITRLTPTDQKCRISLTFKHIGGSAKDIWNFPCKADGRWDYPLPAKHRILITTGLNVQEDFKENEAYCIDINVKEMPLEHELLHLDCAKDSSDLSTTSTTTPVPTDIQENKTVLISNPTTTQTVTVKQGTQTIGDPEFSSTLYISVGSAIGGMLVILLIILFFLLKRRYNQKKDRKEDYVNTKPMPLYDDLLPPTPIDSSANYSTLQSL